jgi:hypothetical protein
MNNINKVDTIKALVRIMDNHKNLIANDIVTCLKIDLVKDNNYRKLRELYLNAYRYIRERLIIS